jgi:PhnB protein
MKLAAYLSFNGQCEQALRFYESALGAKIISLFKYGGSPMEEHVPPEWRDKVMHATIEVGGQTLMAADSPPQQYAKPQGFSLSLHPADVPSAERVFTALSQNGTVMMPLQQTFWSKRFGVLVDQFGTPWMVNCEETEAA